MPLSSEHELLLAMAGQWQLAGDWYPFPGKAPVPISGHMVNRQIFSGLYLESAVFFNEVEVSRAIYGYDPADSQYVAFAINASSSRYDVELGKYDKSSNSLVLTGIELTGPERTPLRFQRKIEFCSEAVHILKIEYPDKSPEHQLGMCIELTRQ